MLGNSARFWKVRAMPKRGDPVGGTASRSLPFERHPAVGGLVDPADDVEHRGLAGAVRTDEAADLARVDRERQAVERGDAAEAHGDVFDFQYGQRVPPLPIGAEA